MSALGGSPERETSVAAVLGCENSKRLMDRKLKKKKREKGEKEREGKEKEGGGGGRLGLVLILVKKW